MSQKMHDLLIRAVYGVSNRFTTYTTYTPLTPSEFRTLSTNDMVQKLPDDKLDRLWLKPIQRMLQQMFRIDQRAYSTGTIPSSTQLDEDFKVAAAITVDKFHKNEEEIIGRQNIDEVGSAIRDLEIPQRARQLLERYNHPGGRVGRA